MDHHGDLPRACVPIVVTHAKMWNRADAPANLSIIAKGGKRKKTRENEHVFGAG